MRFRTRATLSASARRRGALGCSFSGGDHQLQLYAFRLSNEAYRESGQESEQANEQASEQETLQANEQETLQAKASDELQDKS